mmetsp:Transcript_29860/g.86955  ORF Transcript_29860/g.86955 Transcript_29860/m.86955 type:complete len:505 (-) Transcript_29860:28-1542(-)
MGSGVTAGQEIYFNQTYPQVLADLLSPVLLEAGVGLVVRNHATPTTRAETSAYCVEAIVGNDIDVLLWEYNSIFRGPTESLEFFIRNTASLPRNPTFVQVLGFDKGSVDPTPPKLLDELGKPMHGKLVNISMAERKVLVKYRGHKKNSKLRYFEVWVPFANFTDLPGARTGAYKFKHPSYWSSGGHSILHHYQDTGTLWSDSEGFLFPIRHRPEFWSITQNSGQPFPGNEHGGQPGPLAHKLRGMSIAYAFLDLAEQALALIARQVSTASGGRTPAQFLSDLCREFARRRVLPEPLSKGCAAPGGICTGSPKCSSTMEPHFPRTGLSRRVTKDSKVVDRRHGGLEPLPADDPSAVGAWQLAVPPWEASAVLAWSKTHAGYLSQPWGLYGTATSGWLRLNVDISEHGAPVAMCEARCPSPSCSKDRGSLKTDVQFEIDGEPAQGRWGTKEAASRLAYLVSGKSCVQIAPKSRSRTYADGGLSRGRHTLGVRVSSKKEGLYILVTQ